MKAAVRQARRGVGRTSPNPPVGAVVVRGEDVLARGFHRAAGTDHAEVDALSKLREGEAAGAEMYVTLEPCDHQGLTPPCTKAIVRASIRRVVVGCLDPNPSVSGRGVERLKENGIETVVGVEEDKCRRLVEPFAVAVTKGRAHVLIKAAVTLDGRIAARTGHARWVSGPASLRLSHRLRDECDVVAVGGGTLRADDPRLSCRLPNGRGRDPARLVLSASLDFPLDAKIFSSSGDGKRPRVIVATSTRADAERGALLEERGVEVWRLPAAGGQVEVGEVARRLATEGLNSLLVEGGGGVHASFLNAGVCDRVVFIVAPKILGGNDGVPAVGGSTPATMAGSILLEDVVSRRYGDDVVIEGVPSFDTSGVGPTRVHR